MLCGCIECHRIWCGVEEFDSLDSSELKSEIPVRTLATGFARSVSNATGIGSTNTRRIADTQNVTTGMIIAAIITACSSRHAVIPPSIVGGLALSY